MQNFKGKGPGSDSWLLLLFACGLGASSIPVQAASALPNPGATAILLQPSASFQLLDRQGTAVAVRPPCGVGGFESCAKVLPSLKGVLFGQVKTHLDAAYEGKLLASGGGVVASSLIQTPTCNLKDSVYGASPEVDTNHLGNTCGTPCKFKCIPPGAGQTLVSCSMDEAAGNCSRERAWVRGTAFQSIWYAYDEVVREMSASGQAGKITLSPTCQGLVLEPQTAQIFEKANAEILRFQKINQGRPVSCPNPAPSSSVAPTAVLTGAEQAGCYLAASRASLESLVATVATCEVFARGWAEFQRNAIIMTEGLPGTQAKKSRAKCSAQKGSAPAFENCLNGDYERGIKQTFVDQMEKIGNAPTERPAAARR